MSQQVTEEELARREETVRRALADAVWRRPIEIAEQAGLHVCLVLATLQRMEARQMVRRRDYKVPAFRGRVRKRLTSKPIVEYQIVEERAAWSLWPVWLMPGLGAGAAPGAA